MKADGNGVHPSSGPRMKSLPSSMRQKLAGPSSRVAAATLIPPIDTSGMPSAPRSIQMRVAMPEIGRPAAS